ncbi:MAG TPA: biotin--[acetyl-CoA-carboxylase] ligase [Candidatus Binatia bacterium]|nr:biotin--[acetyl-CoA-carboxylase] ligase [Candidatus Binatia bacterium]
MPEGLIAEQLQADLAIGVIGREVIVLDQAGSTNDAILQIANANSKEGLVVFAEHQTAGRGQRGNRWESAAGKGLWFSILLRPRIDLASSPQLTAWAAEAVSNAIQNEFSLTPTIKSPNDVQIPGGKVAGVLVEMRAQQNAPHLAIAGIGVNVNQSREDFPRELQSRAISLAMALGKQINRQSFAVALLRKLDRTYCEKFASAGL